MAVIKHPAQRVGVFIDTQNLYHSAKHLYKARVNFANILEEAVGGRILVRAIAYVIKTESGEEKNFFEALNVLSFVSAVTEKVKLQIGVLVLPIRNPLHIAKGAHIDLSARILLRPGFCIYENLTRSMPPATHWPAGGRR